MKKFYFWIIPLLIANVFCLAQTLVGTSVEPRNAVLEEFTGINCVNCPDGHARANALAAAHPGRVVIINVHSGYFAVPSGTQPDYRTPYGDILDDFAGVAAYPSGTMNRIIWPGVYNQPPYYPQNPPNQLAIRRPGWWEPTLPGQGAGEWIILNGGNSPVNIGAATTWDAVTRNLTVNVEIYYTANDSATTNELNVVFTENGIFSYQSGGGNNYHHRHMLREMITGQWGDPITGVAQGAFYQRTYNYTVPANFNIDSCEISIFVTRDNHKGTHTGLVFPAKNGTTVGVNEIPAVSSDLIMYPNPANENSMVSFYLEDREKVSVDIYNIIGKKAANYEAGYLDAGSQLINLKQIVSGSSLNAGLYLLKLKAGEREQVIKFEVR